VRRKIWIVRRGTPTVFGIGVAEERARERPDLLTATEKQLKKIAAATQRPSRPLRGEQDIGLRAGNLHYKRKTANIEREQNPDGTYVTRTGVSKESIIQLTGRRELQKPVRRGSGPSAA